MTYIETFPVGPLQCNCSIIADETTGDAMIVDPGDEAPRIIARIEAKGFTVRYLLHTHAHVDHVAATADVKAALGGHVCLHKDDLFLYDNLAMQSQFLGMSTPRQVPVDTYLAHDDTVAVAGLRVRTLYTPGHTPGSICFLWSFAEKSILFSGDTLFAGSIGRTDLWGGDHAQIMASLQHQILPLDPDVLVIPGHGPSTKIGIEKRYNPFLQG